MSTLHTNPGRRYSQPLEPLMAAAEMFPTLPEKVLRCLNVSSAWKKVEVETLVTVQPIALVASIDGPVWLKDRSVILMFRWVAYKEIMLQKLDAGI